MTWVSGDNSRGKGTAQVFCCCLHVFSSQEAEECFGWLSAAGAAEGVAEGHC